MKKITSPIIKVMLFKIPYIPILTSFISYSTLQNAYLFLKNDYETSAHFLSLEWLKIKDCFFKRLLEQISGGGVCSSEDQSTWLRTTVSGVRIPPCPQQPSEVFYMVRRLQGLLEEPSNYLTFFYKKKQGFYSKQLKIIHYLLFMYSTLNINQTDFCFPFCNFYLPLSGLSKVLVPIKFSSLSRFEKAMKLWQ